MPNGRTPWVPNIRYPDLASIMSNAAQVRESRERVEQMRFGREAALKEAQAKLDRELKLQEARSKALTGDIGELGKLAPKELKDIGAEQRARATERRAAEAHELTVGTKLFDLRERRREERNALDKESVEAVHNAIITLQATPPEERINKYMEQRADLMDRAQEGLIKLDPGALPDPQRDPTGVQEMLSDEWLEGAEEDYRNAVLEHADPKRLHEEQDIAAGNLGFSNAWTAMRVKPEAFKRELDRIMQARKAAGVTVQLPGDRVPPTTGVVTTLEQGILMYGGTIRKADRVIDVLEKHPNIQTGWFRLKEKGAEIGEFLAGPERLPQWAIDIQTLRQELVTDSRAMFIDLLTAKSGKQVTDEERKFLLRAYGDADSMSHTKLIAAIRRTKLIAEEDRAEMQDFLGRGIPLTEQKKPTQKQLVEEMTNLGFSRDQQIQLLKDMGEISEEEIKLLRGK